MQILTDFLYTDFIEFGIGTIQQKVELVTLVQDAYFIYPNEHLIQIILILRRHYNLEQLMNLKYYGLVI